MSPRQNRGRHVQRPPWWQRESWQEIGWALVVVGFLFALAWVLGVIP